MVRVFHLSSDYRLSHICNLCSTISVHACSSLMVRESSYLSIILPNISTSTRINFNTFSITCFEFRKHTRSYGRHVPHSTQVNLKIAVVIFLPRTPWSSRFFRSSSVPWYLGGCRGGSSKVMVRDKTWIGHRK